MNSRFYNVSMCADIFCLPLQIHFLLPSILLSTLGGWSERIILTDSCALCFPWVWPIGNSCRRAEAGDEVREFIPNGRDLCVPQHKLTVPLRWSVLRDLLSLRSRYLSLLMILRPGLWQPRGPYSSHSAYTFIIVPLFINLPWIILIWTCCLFHIETLTDTALLNGS